MAKYDELSFKKAFAAARADLGKNATFTWKGKSYSTRLKEEPAKATKKDVAPKTSVRPRAKPPAGDAMKGYRKGDITTTSLDNTRPTGRGDGSKEVIQRAAQRALDKFAAASKYPATDTAAKPAGMTKPKPLTGADMSDPQKRKDYAAAMAAYNRSLKG